MRPVLICNVVFNHLMMRSSRSFERFVVSSSQRWATSFHIRASGHHGASGQRPANPKDRVTTPGRDSHRLPSSFIRRGMGRCLAAMRHTDHYIFKYHPKINAQSHRRIRLRLTDMK